MLRFQNINNTEINITFNYYFLFIVLLNRILNVNHEQTNKLVFREI